MPPLPWAALIAGLIWILVCVLWLVRAARKLAPQGAPRAQGYPGRYPVLLINGIALIGLAPVVSAVQYLATRHLAFWAGACDLFLGLVFIVYHLIVARRPTNWASRPAIATFREKSIVVQIVSILLVYSYFAVRLWGFWDYLPTSATVASAVMAIGALIGITVCMIIIGVAAHIALAMFSRQETLDERDRVIGLRGSRNAYGALTVGIWCILFLAIAGAPHGALFYAIMGAFALSELVRLGSQLVYYRLGV